MPSRRAVAFVLAAVWTTVGQGVFSAHAAAEPQVQAPPRDPAPGGPRQAGTREQELTRLTRAEPTNIGQWLELAKLQEERGAHQNAEQTLTKALAASDRVRGVLQAVAAFYNRLGEFEKCIAALEEIAAKEATDAQAQQLVAVYYHDKASRDLSVTPKDRERYADLGIAATDRALALRDDYPDAMVYKSLLLRVKANLEGNAAMRDALTAEADALRNRAIELNKASRPANVPEPSPPPAAPPPPPAADPLLVDGVQPVRVGGDVKVPTKIRDQRPTYPELALQARVTGMVILEALIDTKGIVRSAKVLRSIPLLDAAAIEAVKGWRYDPATVPVPLLMTVTVNFTIQ